MIVFLILGARGKLSKNDHYRDRKKASFVRGGMLGTYRTGPRFYIKTVFPRYGDSHVKDKTVASPFYL